MLKIVWVRKKQHAAREVPAPIRRRIDNLKRVRRRLRDEMAEMPEQGRQAHLERIGDVTAEIDAIYALLKAARS